MYVCAYSLAATCYVASLIQSCTGYYRIIVQNWAILLENKAAFNMASSGKVDLISFEEGWNDEIKVKVRDLSVLHCYVSILCHGSCTAHHHDERSFVHARNKQDNQDFLK